MTVISAVIEAPWWVPGLSTMEPLGIGLSIGM